jgi:hypothetical protein
VAGSFVWRAAIGAAVVNVALNPGVAWVANGGADFVPAGRVTAYVLVVSIVVTLLVSLLGARRAHHRVAQHHTLQEGSAWERHLVSGLPAPAWSFGLLLGVLLGLAAALVLSVMGVFGWSGLSFGAFSATIAVYTGAVAFLVMRWVILRQLMTRAPVPAGSSAD